MSLKKLLIIGCLVALIIFGVRYFKNTDQQVFHEVSVDRVQKMFDNLESGRTADKQDAMGYWRVGHPEGASQEILAAFEAFLEKKGLPRQIQSYEYVSSELIDGDDMVNRYVLLKCRIEGWDLSMIIRHKIPIQWAN